jgi:hypothetical protein
MAEDGTEQDMLMRLRLRYLSIKMMKKELPRYSEQIGRFEPPNQSPEPAAVGAFSSAIAVHAARRRWFSFGRSAYTTR